jgi:hypothetical protein
MGLCEAQDGIVCEPRWDCVRPKMGLCVNRDGIVCEQKWDCVRPKMGLLWVEMGINGINGLASQNVKNG